MFVTMYIVCTELLSNNNNALWKDIEEGKIRCLMHLGRPQEALDCTSHLVSDSSLVKWKIFDIW